MVDKAGGEEGESIGQRREGEKGQFRCICLDFGPSRM